MSSLKDGTLKVGMTVTATVPYGRAAVGAQCVITDHHARSGATQIDIWWIRLVGETDSYKEIPMYASELDILIMPDLVPDWTLESGWRTLEE